MLPLIKKAMRPLTRLGIIWQNGMVTPAIILYRSTSLYWSFPPLLLEEKSRKRLGLDGLGEEGEEGEESGWGTIALLQGLPPPSSKVSNCTVCQPSICRPCPSPRLPAVSPAKPSSLTQALFTLLNRLSCHLLGCLIYCLHTISSSEEKAILCASPQPSPHPLPQREWLLTLYSPVLKYQPDVDVGRTVPVVIGIDSVVVLEHLENQQTTNKEKQNEREKCSILLWASAGEHLSVKPTLIFDFSPYIRVMYNLQIAREEKLLGTACAKFNSLAPSPVHQSSYCPHS